jgi:hypothetical protein
LRGSIGVDEPRRDERDVGSLFEQFGERGEDVLGEDRVRVEEHDVVAVSVLEEDVVPTGEAEIPSGANKSNPRKADRDDVCAAVRGGVVEHVHPHVEAGGTVLLERLDAVDEQ